MKFLLLYALFRWSPVLSWLRRERVVVLLLSICCAGIVVSAVLGGVPGAIEHRTMIHDEVTVLSIAAAHHNGQAMYPDPAGHEEYALLYGPVTYLAYEVPMLFGAQRTGAFQWWVLAALASTFVFVWLFLRAVASPTVAWLGCSLVAACVVRNADYTWGLKGDPWMLLLTAIAFFAAMRLRPPVAAIITGCALALACDIKPTFAVFALIPAWKLWS